MDITIIYKNGETIGAYRSYKRAMKELIASIQDVCPERTAESIMTELEYNGSVDDFWYYDELGVDMEGDD